MGRETRNVGGGNERDQELRERRGERLETSREAIREAGNIGGREERERKREQRDRKREQRKTENFGGTQGERPGTSGMVGRETRKVGRGAERD